MFRSRSLFSNLWSKSVAGNRRKAAAPRPRRTRLQLEYLEERVVPATINVTTLADGTGAGTLRSAIAQANTNDATGDTTNIINLNVAGTYNIGQLGLGALQIFTNAKAAQSGLSLTIQNNSGGNVIISGNNQTRVFDINPNDIIQSSPTVALGAVTIDGVAIENGLAQPGDGAGGTGGGIRDQGPVDLNLNNDLLSQNSATADGGGVSMENATSTHWALMLNNTTVSNNHAGDAGGGVEEDGTGFVSITNSTITGNTTLNQGAGVWLDAIAGATATLNVTNSFVAGNSAGMLGGGIGNAGSGAVSILDSTIESNSTIGVGGGFAAQSALNVNSAGTLAVQNSFFLDNTAGTNGGGIQEGNGLTITNSEIKGNSAGINGGVPIGTTGGGGSNGIQGSGGGLFVNGAGLTLTNSTVADNTATINGGGIELDTNAPSVIKNSTIVGNTALNNTVSPAAPNDGGGIDDPSIGTLALIDDTITGNFAANGGGLFFGNTTGLTVQNTIIAENVASGVGPDVDFSNATTPTGVDQGGNLIGIAGTAGNGNGAAVFTNGTTQTGSVASPLNPLVTGLTDNGGQLAGSTGHQIVVETEALLPGSPAIGKGVANGITLDERGFGRVNTIDDGAFQFADATLAVNISAANVDINGSETITITVTNTSNNPLPADNGTLVVSANGGLNIGGPQTFSLGALGAGQSATFRVNATAVAVGPQAIYATVTTPDSNPLTLTTRVTVTVLTPPTTPVGALSLFALGFGPTGLDVFEVDTKGDIFAQGFGFSGLTGSPIFLGMGLQFPVLEFQNNMLLGFLETGGQNYLVDVFSFFDPFVLPALLAGLHI